MVERQFAKVGVVGHPVEQSLSPLLHQQWLQDETILGSYQRIDGESAGGFVATLKNLRQSGWRGINVTIPYKAEALACADEASEIATQLGAANLLVFDHGKIIADNTDWIGFYQAIEASAWRGTRGHARVIGAGGAAPAVILALLRLGFSQVSLTNRTSAKATALKDRFDNVSIISWDQRDHSLEDVDLLVNTTSLGMLGQTPLTFSLDGLPKRAAVIDIITTPITTPLLQRAQAMGHFVMNGLPMLVYQAAPSFTAWFGRDLPDPAAMIPALERHLAKAKPNDQMLVIGLTGGIGMGKSATAKFFAEHGIPVWDADAAVHRLYAPRAEGAIALQRQFGDILAADGSVDREKLLAHLNNEPNQWKTLEHIIHPLVGKDRNAFIAQNAANSVPLVLVDIPLLLEGPERAKSVDVVIVCSAPEDVRKARVMARPGMTVQKYAEITGRQMPDKEKRALADYIIETDKGLDAARGSVKQIVSRLTAQLKNSCSTT